MAKAVIMYLYRHHACAYSSSSLSRRWEKTVIALLTASFLVLSTSPSITQASLDYAESDGGAGSTQWQILTTRNFSSQIRLHPYILLMVTVPWSGESQSLMKDLSQIVSHKKEKFGTLKLMLLYRNRERMLAEAIDATEGITILCYHHSLYYKYQGRLQAQNVLSSVHFLMSLRPEELPLEHLEAPEDLKSFLQSTDKALLLLEFCGWTRALLAMGKNNGTENAFVGLSGAGFSGEANTTLAAEVKKNQKGKEIEKMTCGIHRVNEIPWLGEFSSVGDADFLEAGNATHPVEISCSFEEFQQYDSFFSKFMGVAREFFLPPERLRFGLVTERSLLSSLDLADSGFQSSSLDFSDSDSWFMVLYSAGCPRCSKVLREGDDLKSALKMQNSLLVELGGAENDPEPALPANGPSIILFIDRSSDSSTIRRRSEEAIEAFRKLALHHETLYGIGDQNIVNTNKLDTYQASRSMSGHQKLKPSPRSQSVVLKDKISIVVRNDGKHVALEKIASGLQGNSFRDILAYVLQHKKEVKLSSLAKEVGFQLLSEDLDIKIQEALPAETELIRSDEVLEKPVEDLSEPNVDWYEDQIPYMVKTTMGHEEQYRPTNAEGPSDDTEKKTTVDISVQTSREPKWSIGSQVLDGAEDAKVEQNPFVHKADMGEKKLHFMGFTGSFFYSDGEYQLLRALTAGSKIPSVVIVDPILQKHYVLSEGTVVSYSSLLDFLDGFLNGSLVPYQRSESVVPSPREAPPPPFVNLDFHEVDSIPRVTTHTFSELVIGLNRSDASNGYAWKKDVLVLFTNSWCGFCLRMELVVREVYRAFMRYTITLRNGPRKKESISTDDMKDNPSRIPLIYSMDCTLNDCSLILKPVSQGEHYPSLLLFPAEKKNAVFYNGDVAVSDIINFIADNGNNAHNLVKKEGILRAGVERDDRKQSLREDASKVSIHKEAPLSGDRHHEVLLRYRTPERADRYNQIRLPKSNSLNVVAGSLLIATEKLLNAHPFDKATILIVKADQGTGFQGLIINKHISWDYLRELDDGLEQFIREARLSFGGPVLQPGMPLVALSRRTVKEQYPEVMPNIYFLDQWATIDEIEELKLRNHSVNDYWFFLGYSSWGWYQLFDEIAQGAWEVSNDDTQQLNWPWR